MRDYHVLLEAISEQYRALLGVNLTGIYVHGSIAFGCFNWDRSDIDFIVVVENPVPAQTKLELLGVLEELCGQAPKKGFEMSVVLKEHCQNFLYPTPYELHFSNTCRLERYSKNPALLSKTAADRDLAAHFTVIRHAGLAVTGEPIARVFGDVPKEDYFDSIQLDIENAGEEVRDNPVYIILNLCRVCAYASDGLILSKEQGGRWGMDHLPRRYYNLIAAMLDNYTKGKGLVHGQEPQAGFCEYMLEKIANMDEKEP